jgi:hypothetical protein
MAVKAELAGRSVRCPHCKQVLTAPAAAPPPVPGGSQSETAEIHPTRPESGWQPPPGHHSVAPEDSDPELSAMGSPKKPDPFGALFGSDSDDGGGPDRGRGRRRPDGSESIFEEPAAADDNVFGGDAPGSDRFGPDSDPITPPTHRAALPPPDPDPFPPAPPPLGTRGSQGVLHLPPQGYGPAAPPPAYPPQPQYVPPSFAPQPISSGLQAFAPVPAVAPGNPWAEMTGEMPGLPDPPPPPPREPRPPTPVPTARSRPPSRNDDDDEPAEAAGEPAPPPVRRKWVVPVLLAYGLVMTAVAVWSVLRGPEGGALSTIPDFYGEYEKSDRKSGKVNHLPKPDDPIPPALRVALGKTITVGQLQVTPLSIEQKRLTKVTVPDAGPPRDEVLPPALVLTLRLKNVSDAVTFHAVDPAFNRRAERGQPSVAGLYVPGKPPIFGGPIPWPFAPSEKRVYVKGQESDDQPLKPGEQRDVLIPLVDQATVKSTVLSAKGQNLTWKVLLRRGTVRYWFSDYSVCTLIGVEFAGSEVKWLPADPPGKG